MVWPAIIAGAAAIGGSLLAADQNRKSSNQAVDAQTQFNRDNIALQREFAQQGIRWKVDDAVAAGLHPLAALGAQTHSFSPIQIGNNYRHDSTWADIGQDISRAISTQKTKEERQLDAIKLEAAKTQLEGIRLDNARKLKDINSTPPMPSVKHDPLGVVSGDIEVYPASGGHEYVRNQIPLSGKMGVTSGEAPLETGFIDKDGYLNYLPSQGASESLEGSPLDAMTYSVNKWIKKGAGYWKSYFRPTEITEEWVRSKRKERPKVKVQGKHWVYSPTRQTWRLVKGEPKYFFEGGMHGIKY